jgi:hypothetical protein
MFVLQYWLKSSHSLPRKTIQPLRRAGHPLFEKSREEELREAAKKKEEEGTGCDSVLVLVLVFFFFVYFVDCDIQTL